MFCNGLEICEPGNPAADDRGCVLGADPCTASQTCDEASDRCVTDCSDPDADHDGDRDLQCGGGDCDDSNPNVNSGATERCDEVGLDEDCDPETIYNDDPAGNDGSATATGMWTRAASTCGTMGRRTAGPTATTPPRA